MPPIRPRVDWVSQPTQQPLVYSVVSMLLRSLGCLATKEVFKVGVKFMTFLFVFLKIGASLLSFLLLLNLLYCMVFLAYHFSNNTPMIALLMEVLSLSDLFIFLRGLLSYNYLL